jgi:hypothetical protein
VSDNTVIPPAVGGDVIRTIQRPNLAKTQLIALDIGGEAGPESIVTPLVPFPVQPQQTVTPLGPVSAPVTNVDTTVVAANASRKGLVVFNVGPVAVFFGMGVAAILNGGIALLPNGTWVMDPSTFFTGAIHAICSFGSTLAIQEYN